MNPKTTLALSLLTLLAAAATAQDLVHKAPPQTRPIGIRGATFHTVSGEVVRGGALLFENGRITSVFPTGARPTGPADTHWIDVTEDTHVYPGLVSLNSTMGLAEVGSVDMTLDVNEAGSITPEVRAGVAVNADSWVIPVTRANGILTCGVMPTGGRVSGRATVIRMDGWTWRDLEILPDAGLVLNWPGMGPYRGHDKDGAKNARKAIAELDALFDAALAYHDARAVDPSIETDLRLEAVVPAAQGRARVFLGASSLLQIESAVAWAVERELDFVLVGGRDARHTLDLLRRHDVPVAITSAHRLPSRRDVSFAEPYELPALLEAAGVRWCLTVPAGSWTNANLRNLPYEAAACLAHGLSDEAALRSITLAPARMLGVGAELGSLEEGKRATLFLADGDLFELSTTIERAFVDGREIDLTTKQTALDAKYREKYRQLGELRPPRE